MNSSVAPRQLTNGHFIAAVSSIYIVADAVFAAGLAPVSALVTTLGCFGALALSWRAPTGAGGDFIDGGVRWGLLAACVASVLALGILSGVAHFFYINADWLIRDAVLADLSRHSMPLIYAHEGGDLLLRAPLGMYLLPALAGRLGGLQAAHLALLAQNALLLGATVYVVASLSPRKPYLAIALFLAFSGLDVVAQLKMISAGTAKGLWPPRHIEWWNMFFQYSSHVTQIFWVPNHAAPGWWLAALALLAARREYDVARLGVMTAVMAMWSPLAMIAAPPLLLYFAARDRLRDLREPRLWLSLCVSLLFLPFVVYLVIASEGVPNGGFLLGVAGFVPVYLMFITIEIPHAAVVYELWKQVDARQRGLALTAIGLLLAIPLYAFGPSNDFAMRVSIAPLALLAFAFISLYVEIDWRARPGLGVFATFIIVVGAVTPFFEIARAFYYPRFAISQCDLLTATKEIDGAGVPDNYVARFDRAPKWLIGGGIPVGPTLAPGGECWPNHPLPDETRPEKK